MMSLSISSAEPQSLGLNDAVPSWRFLGSSHDLKPVHYDGRSIQTTFTRFFQTLVTFQI